MAKKARTPRKRPDKAGRPVIGTVSAGEKELVRLAFLELDRVCPARYTLFEEGWKLGVEHGRKTKK